MRAHRSLRLNADHSIYLKKGTATWQPVCIIWRHVIQLPSWSKQKANSGVETSCLIKKHNMLAAFEGWPTAWQCILELERLCGGTQSWLSSHADITRRGAPRLVETLEERCFNKIPIKLAMLVGVFAYIYIYTYDNIYIYIDTNYNYI